MAERSKQQAGSGVAAPINGAIGIGSKPVSLGHMGHATVESGLFTARLTLIIHDSSIAAHHDVS